MEMIHKNDDVQSEIDPDSNYRKGVFLRSEILDNPEFTISLDCGVAMIDWDGRLFNCHQLPAINPETGGYYLDGKTVAYGIRWELDKWQGEEWNRLGWEAAI